MEKKITKRDMFEMIKDVCANNTQIVDFCKHEIELLDKKASSSSSNKNKEENEAIKKDILNALIEVDKKVTITELQSLNENMSKFSNQKLSALLKQMVEIDKTVEKETDKKKSYFKAI